MRKELADPSGRSFVFVWQVLRGRDRCTRPSTSSSSTSRSPRSRTRWAKADPLDAFLDLSLAEDLETQFVLAAPPDPRRRAATEQLIRDPLVMAGSSDGGAHLLSFCGADYTTRLLTEWVRRAHPRGGGGPSHVDPGARPRPPRPGRARDRARRPTSC